MNMKAMEPPTDEVMDYRCLSSYLKMGQGTLRHKVMKGEMPCIKIGRSVRFSKKQIDAWLEGKSRKQQGAKTASTGNNSGLFPTAGGGVSVGGEND